MGHLGGKRSLLSKVNRRLMGATLRSEVRQSGQFLTRRYRPKSASDVGDDQKTSTALSTAPLIKCEPCAIVMQGPTWDKDDFTFQTLEIYAKHMPNCRLILSTWDDTNPETVDRFRRSGVEVVLNEKPKVPGLYNVNMQVTTASAGIRRAAEHGAEWVLKTRTDQRLYHPEVMSGLAALAKSFPVSGSACGVQKYRIFGVGQGTAKFAPYHLSDQTVFGHVDDMLLYWTPPLRAAELPSTWPGDPKSIFLEVPIGEFCQHGAAESYLTSEFLKRLGRSLSWTLEDSWSAFADHLAVVDYGATDFIWVKIQGRDMREDTVSYRAIHNRRELSFLEWMQLYSGQLSPGSATHYEHVLSKPFTTALLDEH